MDKIQQRPLAGSAFVGLLVYLSTPNLLQFGASGNIDALCVSMLTVGICHFLLTLGQRLGLLLASVGLFMVVAFNLASRFYLEQQQVYPSAQTLYLISEIGSLVSSYDHWIKTFFVVIAIGGVAMFFWIHSICRPLKIRSSLFTSASLVCSCLLLQVAYAGITVEERFSRYEATPLGYFIRSTGVLPFINHNTERVFELERTALLKKIIKDGSTVLPPRYSQENLNQLLGRKNTVTNDPLYPFFSASSDSKLHAPVPPSNKMNVLILVLESVRASEMGLYGAMESATPFLDALGKEKIFAKKFYATSNFTVKSEHAIHCSMYDYMIGAPLSKRGMDIKTMCLPKMLQASGYRTVWFHGNNIEFYNRAEYLPKIGFSENLGLEILNKDNDLPVLGWGISDPALFDVALDNLNAFDEPFYAEILTVSNHMPFDYTWDIDFPPYLAAHSTMYERYRRGIYYTDQAVKGFYNRFKNSKLADNTILVITGDHGVWTFPDSSTSNLQKNEQLFRVPLIMDIPNSDGLFLDGNYSHLDIAPTIADVLQFEQPNDFLGMSMLKAKEELTGRAIYLMTEQALSFRFDNQACVPSVQCQNNINCYKTHEMEHTATQCYTFNSVQDLLFDFDKAEAMDATVSANQRALFDYAQISLELGTLPDSNSMPAWVSYDN